MTPGFSLFSTLFNSLKKHRTLLFAVTAAIIAASVFAARNGKMSEDIAGMLPDNNSEAALDFQLLQQAPLSRRGIISLKAGPGISTEVLLQVTDRLAHSMMPPFFTKVVTGPDLTAGPDMVEWLVGSLPMLASEEDLKSLDKGLSAAAVRSKLDHIYKDLQSPAGWAMKGLYQADPLELRMIALRKMEALKVVPDVRIESNHFVSKDGRNALIVAEMGASITDSDASHKLLDEYDRLVRTQVPPTIETTFVSGHRYTVANSDAIKKDLVVVLGCSFVALLLLYVLFLRSWRAVFVFLIPTVVLAFATAATLLTFQTVSAATIGFASVLLGITDDFPIYIYFTLRKSKDLAQSLAQVARPLIFSGVTIVAAFAILLFSSLPGQRQIGVFSMVAIAGSVLLSLIVVPHVLEPLVGSRFGKDVKESNPKPAVPLLVVTIWLLLLGLSLWQTVHLQFNGNINTMGYVPSALKEAEGRIRTVWGDVRGMAMIFSTGPDLERALKTNDLVYGAISKALPGSRLISMAPLLPSLETQKSNRDRWMGFWEGRKGTAILDTLSRESASLGFSQDAFKPFIEGLMAKTRPITLASINGAGLGRPTESLVIGRPDSVTVLTLVPDTPQVWGLRDRAPLSSPNVRVVSPSRFNEAVSKEIVRNFLSYVAGAFSVIVVMLLLLFRDLRKTAYALIPVITGMFYMLGAMGWLGLTFNIFNIVAAIMIIGLAVDFGIFMVYRVTEGHDRTTDIAVLLGGLTTIAGVGMLILARHPALHSIGTTVLLGLAGAIPSALLVIPALYYLCSERGSIGGGNGLNMPETTHQ